MHASRGSRDLGRHHREPVATREPSGGALSAGGGRDKIDELIHRPPALVVEGLQQLRYLILTEGLAADTAGQGHYRNYVWTILLQVDLQHTKSYLRLIERGGSLDDSKIQDDTFRTLATDQQFKAQVSDEAISRILNAYVQAHPGHSYVQGMNVIAAPFLFVARSESQAFALFDKFVTVMCPLYVTKALEGVHTGVELVEVILELVDPALYAHLRSKMLTANLYAFSSVLTFSANTPPLAEVLRLWDMLMAYGAHLNILFVVARVVAHRDALLASDQPMAVFRRFAPLRARAVTTTALGLLQKVPRDVYSMLVRHGADPRVRREVEAYRRER